MKEKIYVKDFLSLLVFYKKPLAIIMVASILCLVQLSFILPKTYRSEFELNIYSKYFKNALISEVIPGMNSIAEMTQTADSMVKETLNDEFIDSIGNDFKIYPHEMSPQQLSKAREQLRNRFEMYSTGGQSYHVSFSHGDPVVTFEVTKKVMDAVRATFINTRIETIENAKKTIQQKLESVNVTKQITDDSISANALASKNPTVLRSEIMKINTDLSALKMQFNVRHPRIVKLEQRKATIQNWLKEVEDDKVPSSDARNEDGTKEYSDAPLLMTGDREISQTIAAKLYIKFNDINIALDIERKSLPGYIGVIVAPQIPSSPLFPKKRLFASLGFMIGLICCFGYVFYNEIMALSSTEKARRMAKDLKGEYFGSMPHIEELGLMTNKTIVWEEKILIEDNSPSSRIMLQKIENS
jgi:chaperonin cofactor prefoldin/capsular polysaccharide biosynthesis protein